MEYRRMLKREISPVRETMGPLPKQRFLVDMVSHQYPEASAQVKEEGATVKEEAQVEMMEGESKPHVVYLPKSDENEDVILPSPRGSLPNDAYHRREGGTIAVAGRSVSLDHSASTGNAPATVVLAASIHVRPLDTDAANLEIKCALMTEIRRYGRRKYTKNGYGRIFKLLEEVQGPLEVQIQFVKFAIKEAARFKRYHLISYLDEFLDKLMSDSTIRSNDLNLSR